MRCMPRKGSAHACASLPALASNDDCMPELHNSNMQLVMLTHENAMIDKHPHTPFPFLALLVQLPQGVGEIACAVVDEKMYVVALHNIVSCKISMLCDL